MTNPKEATEPLEALPRDPTPEMIKEGGKAIIGFYSTDLDPLDSRDRLEIRKAELEAGRAWRAMWAVYEETQGHQVESLHCAVSMTRQKREEAVAHYLESRFGIYEEEALTAAKSVLIVAGVFHE